MFDLLLINIPHNASDREIREWIESRGIGAKTIRIVRHREVGVSPSYGRVKLDGSIELKEAISILDGKRMRNQTVLVREVPADAFLSRF
jgi:RNA recognition motif-containing protein